MENVKVTQKILDAPIIPNGGWYNRIFKGILYTAAIYDAKSFGDAIAEAVFDSAITPEITVVFFRSGECQLYKIRASAIIGKLIIKTGAISESLADLEDYFGVSAPRNIGGEYAGEDVLNDQRLPPSP